MTRNKNIQIGYFYKANLFFILICSTETLLYSLSKVPDARQNSRSRSTGITSKIVHDFGDKVAVPHQYFVPKETPYISGLNHLNCISMERDLQDQLLVISFFSIGWRKYNGVTKLFAPAILKPGPLWSGKQILNHHKSDTKGKPFISMNSTAKIIVND